MDICHTFSKQAMWKMELSGTELHIQGYPGWLWASRLRLLEDHWGTEQGDSGLPICGLDPELYHQAQLFRFSDTAVQSQWAGVSVHAFVWLLCWAVGHLFIIYRPITCACIVDYFLNLQTHCLGKRDQQWKPIQLPAPTVLWYDSGSQGCRSDGFWGSSAWQLVSYLKLSVAQVLADGCVFCTNSKWIFLVLHDT